MVLSKGTLLLKMYSAKVYEISTLRYHP